MQENVQTKHGPSEAHEKRDCCTSESDSNAAVKVENKALSGQNLAPSAAKTSTNSGCCCGSKSPK